MGATARCSRLWEAEAFEDGRLTEADRPSFERHLTTCALCRDEVAQIDAARAAMQHAPAPAWSAIERQRVRNQLLSRANESLTARARVRFSHAALVAVALVAAGTSYGLWYARTEGMSSADVVLPAPAYDLESGRRRSVQEEQAQEAEQPTSENVASTTGPLAHAYTTVDAMITPPAPAPTAHTSASAGSRFQTAMVSFEAGDYARADTELELFARDFASDPRCEDAAYLRAVARFRRGDKVGAASLARAYLAAYPAGLRRIEARRLAAEGRQ
ncbi:MAG: hypothetical protein JWM74_4001 [Myxococcaceae bacterium]|nr:hypothetical protein [Myxococcaceae bacterium]